MEREREREGKEERRKGLREENNSTVYMATGGYIPFILQVEEEVLNCQSIRHNVDSPKQKCGCGVGM